MALAVHAPPRGRVTPSHAAGDDRRPVRSPCQAPRTMCGRSPADDADVANADTNGGAAGESPDRDGASGAHGDKADRPGDRLSDGPRDVAKAGQSDPDPLAFEGPLEDARRAFQSRYRSGSAGPCRRQPPPAPPAASA